jgi:ABC-type uncharacterized transport system permease subunit
MIMFGREVLVFGRTPFLGVPTAIWVFGAVFLVAWVTLRHTTFGRQVYAVGADPRPRPRPASTCGGSPSPSTASAASAPGSAAW